MDTKAMYTAPTAEVFVLDELTSLLATVSANGSFEEDDWQWGEEEL